jgi:hypothetical protein
VQHVGRPDALFGFDEVPAEKNQVFSGEGVDEGLVVNVDLTELRALQQSDEDVHIPIMPIERSELGEDFAAVPFGPAMIAFLPTASALYFSPFLLGGRGVHEKLRQREPQAHHRSSRLGQEGGR